MTSQWFLGLKEKLSRHQLKLYVSSKVPFCIFFPLYGYCIAILELDFDPYAFPGLEINERPVKRPLLDFENLSISDSSSKGAFGVVLILYVQLCIRFVDIYI